MVVIMEFATLFSSESTNQYIKDIFSVLALPRGSVYRFRYDKKYIIPELLADFAAPDMHRNKKVLIAFRSTNKADRNKSFIIPVRWGTIRAINQIINGYTIDFIIDGYPNYTQEFKNVCSSFETLNQTAVQYLYSQGNVKNDYAVWNGILPCVDPTSDNPADRDNEFWTQIVSAITKIPHYSQTLFIRCSKFYTEEIDDNDQIIKTDCNKSEPFYELVEGKCSYVDVEYFSNEYSKEINREIKAYIDEAIISKAKGLRSIIESRYGKITLGFQPQKVSNRTISEIVFSSVSNRNDELPTDITYPIIIVKDKGYKIKKAIMTVLGAIFVALPGIVGNNIAMGWSIIFAILGASILGVNTYWESKE